MASKDLYPKGSAMNMIIPLAFIELVVREVLNRDQTFKKKPVRLDTFSVQVISKSSFYESTKCSNCVFIMWFISVLFFF